MSAERQRRNTRSTRAAPEPKPARAEPADLDADEDVDGEPRENGLENNLDSEELVEVRIAVGPDGIAEALTFPLGEEG